MSRYILPRALSNADFPVSRKAQRAARQALPELTDLERQFYQHLGAEASTDVEPGINQDEFFDDQFERRAHEIQRTPNASNAVNVIPAKTGPWTGNNNLGIQRDFAPDINNQQTIIKLPEWGFPEDWTLCLGLDYNTDTYDPVSTFFGITALMTVGVGGATQEVELDWLNGTTISLPMNALNLVAQYAAGSNEGGAVDLPPDLRLRATLCRGSVRNSRPTRTYAITALDANNDAVVAVPPFAKAVNLYTSGEPTPLAFFSNLTDPVNFISGPDPTTAAIVSSLQRSQFLTYLNVAESIVGAPMAVGVPEGARFLHIPNLTLGAFGGFQVQYLLAL